MGMCLYRVVSAIPCPECRSTTHVSLEGWNSNGPRRCMGINGSVYFIWCQRFKCSSQRHAKAFTFLGYDPRVLEQLPEEVSMQFPAILSHKCAVDKKVWALVTRQIRNGHPIEDIASRSLDG